MRVKMELPPRTRRILGLRNSEKTPEGNYLRVRGEYHKPLIVCVIEAELPPRTRRIRMAKASFTDMGGTTSAYAENTRKRLRGFGGGWNYLRVRGEYILPLLITHFI